MCSALATTCINDHEHGAVCPTQKEEKHEHDVVICYCIYYLSYPKYDLNGLVNALFCLTVYFVDCFETGTKKQAAAMQDAWNTAPTLTAHRT